MTTTVTQLDDRDIPRDRGSRKLVFFTTPVILPIIGYLAGINMLEIFFEHEMFPVLGGIAGATIGFIGFLAIKHLFVVQNSSTGMLVTIDRLRSMFTGKDSHVVYGNGDLICFPWERRLAENNIPVVEVAGNFEFKAVCSDGIVNGTASFRIRPDFHNPLAYLSGADAVDQDFTGLLKAFITDWLASRTIKEAVNNKAELNAALRQEFAAKVSEFEARFGVQVGDITVDQLTLSKEVAETLNARNEAVNIAEGTAIMLGLESVAKMQEAVAAGKLSQAEVDAAQRRFLIVSGQIKDASTSRFEIDLSGVSPEIARVVAEVLTKNPQVLNRLMQMFNSKGAKK